MALRAARRLASSRPPALLPRRCQHSTMPAAEPSCRWQPARQLWLELCTTPDIVASPPGGPCDCLINPANEKLVGTQLAYFPRGGPCPPPPPEGVSNAWGGMEAGANMLYPAQSVDGRVHAAGGAVLREALLALPSTRGERCPVGSAVLTEAHGELRDSYRFILQ